MFWTLVQKELKLIIQSPKFLLTFVICFILIMMSVVIGINEYKSAVKQYETVQELTRQDMESARSWAGISAKPYRKPTPLQIFSAGVNFDVGRFAVISEHREIGLEHSYYSDDPVFAVFRHIDFSFIVTIVLSLLAILYTYNSVNGEREEGTLKLLFSNSIPKAQYILAKISGLWLGLVIPLLLIVLISLLIIIVLKTPITGSEWISILFYLFLSILYFTFFIVLGVLFSARTKKSAISFLSLLVFWIAFVFIIPRVGVMVAGQFAKVPSLSEIESKKASYDKSLLDEFFKKTSDLNRKRNAEMGGMSEAEKEAYEDENSYTWMQENDALLQERKVKLAKYAEKLKQDYDNEKENLEKMALSFARFSPASSFNLAAMNLCGSDVGLKNRYENAISDYKNRFLNFIDKKKESSGSMGGISITMDSQKGMSIVDGRKNSKFDISEVPKFSVAEETLSINYSSIVVDFGLLSIYILLSFAGAVFSFLKYDVR